MHPDYARIYAAVQRIPRGRVATYGQIAALADLPRRARQVGYALHALPPGSPVPWQRVVNARGEVSLPGLAGARQRELLAAEGVEVGASGRIDLKAEIREPEIACTVANGKAKSKLSFWVKSAIAPTSDVAARNVPYFVAIIVEGQVIGKEIFDLALPFEGTDRKLMVKEKIARIDIPVAEGRKAEDYAVTIGFQLTPEQVEYNRTASR